MVTEPRKPIQEIVEELGCYPLAAFAFVQQCIGMASERVHGPMNADQKKVARWMNENEVGPHELAVQASLGQLPDQVAAALDRLGGAEEMNRHVTGRQLCWALRDIALERWGLMARPLLSSWGITCTEDVGRIVFALVENGWLQKQPQDSLEDFQQVFAFPEAFDKQYRINHDLSNT
jgi:uncharacterized repeat protein (TIGR04138 family)